jgi:hypothetical protein
MVTVLEECTAGEQHSVVCLFCGQKDSMQRFIKKCLLFMVGSVSCVKWFTAGSRNSLKDIQKLQIMPTRCGMRQQAKDFCAVDFDALVK